MTSNLRTEEPKIKEGNIKENGSAFSTAKEREKESQRRKRLKG
jgi:hypothetical protein